jgi:hypothetical protein
MKGEGMNNKKILVLVLMTTVALQGMLGCSKSKTDEIVVTYKGGALTVADIEAHREVMKRMKMFRDNPKALTDEAVVEHAANMELIIAKALKEKLHEDPRMKAEIHGFMSRTFLQTMQGTLVPNIDPKSFTDQQLRDFYEKHKKSYRTPEQYGLRIIKSDNEETLKKLKQQIGSGKLSFADAAKKHSLDEQSAKTGGYIGLRQLEFLPPGLHDDLPKMAINQVSDVKPANKHFYLFQLVEKPEPHQFTFEEKAAYIRNDMLYAKYKDAWKETYDKLKKEFDLKIDQTAAKKLKAPKTAPAVKPQETKPEPAVKPQPDKSIDAGRG